MEPSISELQTLAVSHAKWTSEKIKHSDDLQKLYMQHLMGDKDVVEKIMKTQKACQLAQAKGSEIFMEIMQKSVNYLREKKMNYQQLEAILRKNNIGIFIIARKFDPAVTDQNIACELHDAPKPYQANFVVTTNRKFYLEELKKFDYNSIEDNFHNLAEAGTLCVKKDIEENEIRTAVSKVRPDDSMVTKKEVEARIKRLGEGV
jgi:hypothetical protein